MAILAALTPVIAAEIGQPVQLEIRQVNAQGEWAWVWLQPRQADGAALDWSTTALASRYENGVMDVAPLTLCSSRRTAPGGSSRMWSLRPMSPG